MDAAEGFRLSPQQRHLWSLQHGGNALPFRSQCAVLIEGPLRRPVLEAALRDVCARYEIFRTTFGLADGRSLPFQRVNGAAAVSLDAHDWTTATASRPGPDVEAFFEESGRVPFDLAAGPVLRLSLLSLAVDRHVLLINAPALCADAASLRLLVREISRRYSATARDSDATDAAPQYADLAEWANQLLESPDAREGAAHWLDMGPPCLRVPRLPFEVRSPATRGFEPRVFASTLDRDLTVAIRQLVRTYETSTSTFLLASWQLLLARLTGESDFVVGLVCDGRTYEGLQDAPGLLAKTLPVRTQADPHLEFRELLDRTDRSVREAVAFQEYFSFDHSSPSNGAASEPYPFLPVAFEFREAEARHPAGDVVFSVYDEYSCFDAFTLKLSCAQRGDRLMLELNYDSCRFQPDDVERLASELHTLLGSICAEPATAVADLGIVGADERRRVLVDFNDTRADHPEGECVHDLFAERARGAPDCVAAVYGDERMTYGELDARADRLACRLQHLGVGPDVAVAICMERSLEMVAAILGVLKAGGAYVPLDPDYPQDRMAYVIDDVRAAVLLTQKSLGERIPQVGIPVLDDADDCTSARDDHTVPASGVNARNLAYVIYTSGSTGRPKGVMVEHGGLTNAVRWIMDTLELSPSDRSLLKTPMTFDAAGRELFPTLLAGGTLIVAPPGGHRDSRYLAETICSERVTILHCVPSLLRLLVEERAFDQPHALRAVMCGGESLSPEIVRRFHSRFAAALYNVYGPTEAIIDSTCWPCAPADGLASIPIGRPIPNARVYILDANLRPLPIGVPGDLYIGGAGLARGYVGRADLTAAAFVPDPFGGEPGARLYKTGDRARHRRDGSIEFLGRGDYQVKIRGFRIELGEIEKALEGHRAVRQAIVVVHGDDAAQKRLVAYVVTQGKPRPTASELGGFLKKLLPEHMVPAAFMLLESFPLTVSGKVDRGQLPLPGARRPDLDEGFVPSRTPAEQLLAEIWSQVLGVERVGIHDDFFQLGGHSLLATQVVSRIREAFHVEIPLRRLFDTPTIAGLADAIASGPGQGPHPPPIIAASSPGDCPLSFAQQRLWFIDQLDPGRSVYNFPAAVRLEGPLDLAALQQTLDAIAARHAVLRTTFAVVDGAPVQRVAPSLQVPLSIVDLRELADADREPEVRRLATLEAQRPFDLAEGPLVRATVLLLREHEHVGLLTMHHIVSDGWSTGILIRELAALYHGFCEGAPPSLPDLPIQYADFARWQRDWLVGENLDRQLAYWEAQLRGAPPLLDLPTDHPRPSTQSFRGAAHSLRLPSSLGANVRAISRERGVTPFMTLLAAFQVLIHAYTGQDDVVIGTPIANRNRFETEGLIGFFVNTLVLRTDLSGDPAFSEVLRRVREVCLGAYAHQDLPFERLVEALHRPRTLTHNPLFQVMFVIQNAPLESLALPGMTLTPLEIDAGSTHFDLTLHVADTGPDLIATLSYNTDLFDSSSIDRLLRHYAMLLKTLCASPAQHLSDLSLLDEQEQRLLLTEWNPARAVEPTSGCIPRLFEEQVARTPDATAVRFDETRLTYEELNRRANQLANHLRSLGVRTEVPVALSLEHSADVVIGLLAILKAGGVYVPLDPAYPRERIAFLLNDAHVAVLVTEDSLLPRQPAHDARVVCLDSDRGAISAASPENPVSSIEPENLAYVIYTSGSTGRPKGVGISHGSAAEHCEIARRHFEVTSSDRVLQFASLSFDVSLEQILLTLIAGAELVMVSGAPLSTTDFHAHVAALGLTVLNIPTGYWHELARDWADAGELLPPVRLRIVIVGGDTMLPEALELWQRSAMRDTRLVNAYGPTETTITATACDVTSYAREHPGLRNVPIGRPLANRSIHVLNKYGRALPVGIPGELHVGGACLARGYLHRAELTAEAFVPDPFSDEPGARLYRTGDLGRRLPDGSIEFLGRVDHQVKIRGFRIEPGEIEAALRLHPSVRDAVVLADGHASGEKQLIAYFVVENTSSPIAGELRAFLEGRLPDFMIPAVFVPLEALPLMRSGKVDRAALETTDRLHADPARGFVAPRDALELRLTALWEEVLGVRPIGVTDDFFELGGHSLAAVRLFALIERRLGKKVPLATVFRGATVEHLAKILCEDGSTARASSLVSIQPAGGRRPLFLIHPAGGHVFPYVHLASCLGPDQPCYGLQARGVEAGQGPHTRIEEMAAHYIVAMRTLQPEGPYLLGGWSMGGVVAFEMAQQLHAQGQRTALLALLDTRIPTADDDFADEDFEITLLVDFVRYFGLSLDPRASLASLPKHELLERVLEHAKRAGLMPLDIEVSQAQPFIDLCKADFRATRNYMLRRYPGRITLFRADQELGGPTADPTLNWSQWAEEGVDVHVVPGNHATMVYRPHVEVLAETMTALLDEARATEESRPEEAPVADAKGAE